MSAPTRRIPPACCARIASGQAAGTAEQRDERAPFQSIELHSIPTSQAKL
jgi:hypothetical protein